MKKQATFESEKYRRWVASLPCVVSFARNVQCAHIRLGAEAGLGRKPADWRCVPLSVQEHALQHEIGELKYWFNYGGYETAVVLAQQLYNAFPDTAKGTKLIADYHWRWVKRGSITKNHKFIDEGVKND